MSADRLQRIKVSIQRGDYRGLRDGGEQLVRTHAAALGVTTAELIRGWAAGDARATADKATTCGKCGGSGMLDDDTICDECHGTGDENYESPDYERDHDFSSPITDGPDSERDDDDDDEDDDRDHREKGDDDDEDDEED
jgi:hypothetical protein